MSRVVEMVVVEMQREFNARSYAQTEACMTTAPIDLTKEQLDQLSRVYNTQVQDFLVGYVEHLFRASKGVREKAKKAVEECVLEQGALSEGSSVLHRIVQSWFRRNPNPSRGKRDGELTRLRNIKASVGGVKRGRSVSETPVSADGSLVEGMGTPTPGRGWGRTKRGRYVRKNELDTPPRMDAKVQGSVSGSPLNNEVEVGDIEMSDVDAENIKPQVAKMIQKATTTTPTATMSGQTGIEATLVGRKIWIDRAKSER